MKNYIHLKKLQGINFSVLSQESNTMINFLLTFLQSNFRSFMLIPNPDRLTSPEIGITLCVNFGCILLSLSKTCKELKILFKIYRKD